MVNINQHNKTIKTDIFTKKLMLLFTWSMIMFGSYGSLLLYINIC